MFRKISSLIILSLFAGLLSSCSGNAKKQKATAYAHLQLGTAHLRKANYPSAMSELLTSTRLNPEDEVAFNNLALAYLARERYVEAEKSLLKALKINPAYTEGRNNLGRVYLQQGKNRKAISQLKMAVNDLTYKTPHKSHTNLGLAYFSVKKYKSALGHFKISLKFRRENCFALNLYGQTLYKLKKYKDATPIFDQAIPLCKPKNVDEPHYYSALNQLELGHKREAIARLEEVNTLYKNGEYKKKSTEMLKVIRGKSK